MVFDVLAKLLKGGYDTIPKPTKTIASLVVEAAVSVLIDISASSVTSFMDLNELSQTKYRS